MNDTLLTVRDVATIMQCSEDAVIKRFARVPGVIDLGRAESRTKRRYRVLRIPKAIVEKYLSTKPGIPCASKFLNVQTGEDDRRIGKRKPR